MSFLMIVSLAYVTIETIDPEPALASGAFTCLNDDGKAYYFQSTWNSSNNTLEIIRAEDGTNGDASNPIMTYSNWGYNNISEVNSLSMDSDGHMYAVLKQNNNNTQLFIKLNYNATSEGSTTTPTDMNVTLGSGDNNAASIIEVE